MELSCECKKCLDCIFAEIDKEKSAKIQSSKNNNLSLLQKKGYFICGNCGCKSRNKGVYFDITLYSEMLCRNCEIESRRQDKEDNDWYNSQK